MLFIKKVKTKQKLKLNKKPSLESRGRSEHLSNTFTDHGNGNHGNGPASKVLAGCDLFTISNSGLLFIDIRSRQQLPSLSSCCDLELSPT